MGRPELGLRHRAAACHGAAFPVLTSVWLPLLLGRGEPEDGFLASHATGAAYYQGLSLLTLLLMWLGRGLPYHFLDEVSAGFLLTFLGVIGMCLAGLYFMGALALAFQAWNGDPFWAPGIHRLAALPPAEE
jgi:hypothetical protein